MTPKEKAEELVYKFRNEFKYVELDYPIDLYRDAKQCALICVDEIIKTVPYKGQQPWILNTETVEFWNEVKSEIEKI